MYDLADFDRMVAMNVRRRLRRDPGIVPSSQGRRTDYHHRQQYSRSNCIPGSKCFTQ
jgi:hypothetical protein